MKCLKVKSLHIVNLLDCPPFSPHNGSFSFSSPHSIFFSNPLYIFSIMPFSSVWIFKLFLLPLGFFCFTQFFQVFLNRHFIFLSQIFLVHSLSFPLLHYLFTHSFCFFCIPQSFILSHTSCSVGISIEKRGHVCKLLIGVENMMGKDDLSYLCLDFMHRFFHPLRQKAVFPD